MTDRLINQDQVLEKICHGKTRLAQMVNRGTFPSPIKLDRKKVWLESEVDAWIAKLAKQHGKASS